MNRPRLALTIGDAAGVGPEIVMRLLAGDIPNVRLLLIGDRGALERARELAGGGPAIRCLEDPRRFAETEDATDSALLWQPSDALDPLPPLGAVSRESGWASFVAVREAVRLVSAGLAEGIVTGPIHKGAWRAAGVRFPGHTELLAAEAGVEKSMMMLVGGRLRTALATIHVPFREVPYLLTPGRLTADICRLHDELARWFGPDRPHIAVAGLNPHAGEGGLFGREEAEVIGPAVEAARRRGVDVFGPLPADACIPAAACGEWDAVLAMTHDQALPAVKAVAPRRAVNVTLGLPFPRTSVDHGTAFDIAGKGRASKASLEEALRVAVEMIERVRARS